MPVRPPPPIHPLSPIFLFSGDLAQMSTSSATHSKWRQYGPVLLTRCPDCPRPDPLKRLVTKRDDNGNLGREFVKCFSNPMAGRDGKDSVEGYVDSSVAATWELNLRGVPPIAVENTGSSGGGAGRVVPMAMYARNAELHAESELTEELKKVKKHLMQMIDLQKQANIMAGGFYCCIIALFLFYLLFIRH
ncbi:hypothetical protein VPH35_101555 [Triticum aestivum]